MPKAKWTTKATEVKVSTAGGTLSASVPLYDDGAKAATVTFTITADRALEVVVVNEPGSAGLTGFSAWSRGEA